MSRRAGVAVHAAARAHGWGLVLPVGGVPVAAQAGRASPIRLQRGKPRRIGKARLVERVPQQRDQRLPLGVGEGEGFFGELSSLTAAAARALLVPPFLPR
jgi:hypothetical protein